jgi:hypothetical protein
MQGFYVRVERGGYYEYYEGKLSVFPIRTINFATPLPPPPVTPPERKGILLGLSHHQ